MPDVVAQRTADQVVKTLLAQSTPADTAAVTFYSPGTGVETVVKRVIICNVSGGDAAFSLWHDDDGADFTAETQLYNNNTVTAGKTQALEGDIYLSSAGNIGVRSDVTSALTFSMYGEEVRTQAR